MTSSYSSPASTSPTSTPGLVDLTATLRFPALPDVESARELAAQARRGGFARVLVAPVSHKPLGADALLAFAHMLADVDAADRDVLMPAPAPLRGHGELAEVYTLARAGVPLRALRVLEPVDDTLLLRRAFEMARALDLVVIVPSVDGPLAKGAVLVESPVATRLGLPAVPEAAEAIGVARMLELAQLTGARVHLANLFTAKGAALVEAARAGGVRASACVGITHLLLDERAHLEHRYDTGLRVWPPLPTVAAREALTDAVRRGALCVSSGHAAVPKRERDLEMAAATPGASTLATVWTALVGLVGESAAAAALRDGPARVL